ncbi:MAG: carbohydrate ABC transporter permease [Chloroflexi bacterium]|jgi:arabinogalactan oligomer / maltooligosaccharide transport system permease protein|nr:carbohydrate ABC transporter permease [Chloroflexota bacterium]
MRRQISAWEQFLHQLGLVLVGLFVLLPIWGMVYLAFEGGTMGWPSTFRLWPEEPTLRIFQQVWAQASQSMPFLALLKNSLIVSGGAMFFSVILGTSMAYAFARYRFPGRKPGLLILLVGALLPPVALMTPLYVLLTILKLRTTMLGLTIVYTAFSMPFCVWNMRSAFQAVPKDLEEAAFLDGAGALKTFWRISLPIALPSIAVAALIAFLIGYSEFAMGWLFVDTSANVTVAMAVSGALGVSTFSGSLLSALAILMSLPVIALFLILQRYLLDRLLFLSVGDQT